MRHFCRGLNCIFSEECVTTCQVCGGDLPDCEQLDQENCANSLDCNLGGYKNSLGSENCYSNNQCSVICEEPVEEIVEEEVVEEVVEEPVEEIIEEEVMEEVVEEPVEEIVEEIVVEEVIEDLVEEIVEEEVMEEVIEEPVEEIVEEEVAKEIIEEPIEEIVEEVIEEPVEEIVKEINEIENKAPPVVYGGGGSSRKNIVKENPTIITPEEISTEIKEINTEIQEIISAEKIALKENSPEISPDIPNEKITIVEKPIYVEGKEDTKFIEETKFTVPENLKVIQTEIKFEDTEEHWSKEYVKFVSKLVIPTPETKESSEEKESEINDVAGSQISGRLILEDFIGKNFEPDVGINRLQLTKIAVLMYGYGIPEKCPDTDIRFSDIPYEDCNEIAKVVYQGVTMGFINIFIYSLLSITSSVTSIERFLFDRTSDNNLSLKLCHTVQSRPKHP